MLGLALIFLAAATASGVAGFSDTLDQSAQEPIQYAFFLFICLFLICICLHASPEDNDG